VNFGFLVAPVVDFLSLEDFSLSEHAFHSTSDVTFVAYKSKDVAILVLPEYIFVTKEIVNSLLLLDSSNRCYFGIGCLACQFAEPVNALADPGDARADALDDALLADGAGLVDDDDPQSKRFPPEVEASIALETKLRPQYDETELTDHTATMYTSQRSARVQTAQKRIPWDPPRHPQTRCPFLLVSFFSAEELLPMFWLTKGKNLKKNRMNLIGVSKIK
jgi:hypothetical protein